MHHYRRFIQDNLDARGWKQADLVRASGLSRQLINSVLRDDRDYLGQMPDESTLKGLSKGFNVPLETVRTAAARSLVGYSDEGGALTPQLQEVDLDVLLNEIRRRFNDLHVAQASSARTSGEANQSQEAGLLDEAEERTSLRRIEERLSPHGIGIHDPDDAVDERGGPGARGV